MRRSPARRRWQSVVGALAAAAQRAAVLGADWGSSAPSAVVADLAMSA